MKTKRKKAAAKTKQRKKRLKRKRLKVGQTIRYSFAGSVYEGTIVDLWPGGVTLREAGDPWPIQIEPGQVEEILSDVACSGEGK